MGPEIMSDWYLYMVRCADNTLYTGIATNVARRFREHQGGGPRAAKYLRGRGPLCLVFEKRIGDHSLAARVERRIKGLSKGKKEMLLDQKDLFDHIVESVRHT